MSYESFGDLLAGINSDGQIGVINWRNFEFSNDPPIVQGQEYWITFNCGTYTRTKFWGSSSDTVTGAESGTSTDRGTTISPIAGIGDFAALVVIDEQLPTSIHFEQTPTSTCDFSSWWIDQYINSDDLDVVDTWSAQVMYGLAPGAYAYQDFANGMGSVGFPWSFSKNLDATPGQIYYAQASLCDTQDAATCYYISDTDAVLNGHIIATSSEYAFIITTENCPAGRKVQVQGGDYPTGTSTIPGETTTCDDQDGFFAKGLCSMFQWLFIPDPTSVQKLTDLKNRVAAKPPFGYISAYTTAINGLTMASTTTSTLATVTSSAELQLSTWTALPIVDTIRTGLAWIIYLAFGFWVLNRFRKLSLHG